MSAPGESPKDEESEPLQKRVQNDLAGIQKIVSSYPVEHRPEVLTAALEQAMKGEGATEKLVTMEEQIHKVCDNLDVKTKAVLAVLGELSSVGGVSNDVDYGTDLLHSTFRGKQFLDEARKQFPDDPGLACLAEAYELAHCINKTESEPETITEELEDADPEDKEPEESETQDQLEQERPADEDSQTIDQAKEDTDAQDESATKSYSFSFDPKERVRAYEVFEKYLKTRTLEEKQVALALSMLLGKQQYLPDEHIGDKIYKQWRDEVLSIGSPDKLQLKDVPGDEAFCQGYLTAMIIMDG